MENWKKLESFDLDYEISNLGNIRLNGETIKSNKRGKGYLTVMLRKNNKSYPFYIHHLMAINYLNHKVQGLKLVIDHIDNNKLNNNIVNLRIISNRENTTKTRKTASKYFGISYDKSRKKWRAYAKHKGKQKTIGSFNTEIEAAKAYKEYIKNLI